jgi:hypothetical protein
VPRKVQEDLKNEITRMLLMPSPNLTNPCGLAGSPEVSLGDNSSDMVTFYLYPCNTYSYQQDCHSFIDFVFPESIFYKELVNIMFMYLLLLLFNHNAYTKCHENR